MPAYQELISLGSSELSKLDFAEINLRCAEGLPDARELHIPSLLRRLDQWARLIEEGTRNLHVKFRKYPEKYGGTEDRFRMLVFTRVLQGNLGVEYDPSLRDRPDTPPAKLKRLDSSRHHFIHGPLLGFGGTCVTLPLLFVALGRRLGYPLRLALANRHVYCR